MRNLAYGIYLNLYTYIYVYINTRIPSREIEFKNPNQIRRILRINYAALPIPVHICIPGIPVSPGMCSVYENSGFSFIHRISYIYIYISSSPITVFNFSKFTPPPPSPSPIGQYEFLRCELVHRRN